MPIVKRCPYAEELDVGTVTFEWAEEAPDLHRVVKSVALYEHAAKTHEYVTQNLATDWDCHVTTTWRTAGMDVVVECDPK